MQQYLIRHFGFSVLADAHNTPQNTQQPEDMKEGMERILLHCANVVCLTDLPRGAPLSVFWGLTCPALKVIFNGQLPALPAQWAAPMQ